MENKDYYHFLDGRNIQRYLKPLLDTGTYKIRDEDGKYYGTFHQSHETPWEHIVQTYKPDGTPMDCQLWHNILFNYISKETSKPFVPSYCQSCWKVVIRPRTLHELFLTREMMMELGHPSKCGIEKRPYVHGLYGGYFYNNSIEEGLDTRDRVRNAVANHHDERFKTMNPESIILKRACTEFEKLCGPSNKWEITPQQLVLERLANQLIVSDNQLRKQSPEQIVDIHQDWIEYAFMHGDGTYKEFTNGELPHTLGAFEYVSYERPDKKEKKDNNQSEVELMGNHDFREKVKGIIKTALIGGDNELKSLIVDIINETVENNIDSQPETIFESDLKPEPVELSREQQIINAVQAVYDTGKESLLKKDGSPKVRAVEDVLSFDISAAECQAAYALINKR